MSAKHGNTITLPGGVKARAYTLKCEPSKLPPHEARLSDHPQKPFGWRGVL